NHPPPTETYTLSLHDALRSRRRAVHSRPITIPPGEQVRRAYSEDPQNVPLRTLLRYRPGKRAPVQFTRAPVLEKAQQLRPAEIRSEEHTSELQSRRDIVCRL